MIAPPDPRWPGGHDPRWPTQPHHGGWWGWRGPHPVRDSQLGWRMPSGGQPATNNLPLLIAFGFFLLSPLVLVSWLAAQAVTQPRSYLHVVRTSGGWAVCCERCQTTVATTRLRERADWLAVIHPIRCTTTTPWEMDR